MSQFTALVLLSLVMTIAEVFSIALLVPLVELLVLQGAGGDSEVINGIGRILPNFGVSPTPKLFVVGFMVGVVIRQCLQYVRVIYTARVLEGLKKDIRDRNTLRHFTTKQEFTDSQNAGNILNILMTESVRVMSWVRGLTSIVANVVSSFVYLSVLFAISFPLTLAIIGFISLAGPVMYQAYKNVRNKGRLVTKTNRLWTTMFSQRVTRPKLIRIAGILKEESSKLNSATKEQAEAVISVAKVKAKVDVFLELYIIITVAGFSISMVQVFGIEASSMLMFLVVAIRLQPMVNNLVRIGQQVVATEGSVEALERIELLMQTNVRKRCGDKKLEKLKNGITVQNITYRYKENLPNALNDISVFIERGEVTCFVGPSGSGKSTLVELIGDLRDAVSGGIYFDGVDIQEFTEDSIRKRVSILPQQAIFYEGSIGNHIKSGRQYISEEMIENSLQRASVSVAINSLAAGLNTRFTDHGGALSGGELQRIDLARALASQPDFLILDEPTSSVDQISEENIVESIISLNVASGITVLLVTHSLPLANKLADKVHVFENGSIIQSGTPSELLAVEGWYSHASAHVED